MRLSLQVYFLSDIIRLYSLRVIDCYIVGNANKWSYSKYTWPRLALFPSAIEVWQKFIYIIMAGDQFLLSNINTLRLYSCHRFTRCTIDIDFPYLSCLIDNILYSYLLSSTFREDFNIQRIDFYPTDIEIPV